MDNGKFGQEGETQSNGLGSPETQSDVHLKTNMIAFALRKNEIQLTEPMFAQTKYTEEVYPQTLPVVTKQKKFISNQNHSKYTSYP